MGTFASKTQEDYIQRLDLYSEMLAACLAVLSLLALFGGASTQKCFNATDCDPDICKLTYCKCSDTKPPVEKPNMPQIVYLTFNNAFTAQAEEQFYRSLFNGAYRNPDDCPLRATHFLTTSYTDYSLVNKYRNMGHEMGSNSITHRNNITYWATLPEDEWADEFVGLRKMVTQFANIPSEEITGVRAPFLQGGGDVQFNAMKRHGFTYDCSWPTRAYGYINASEALYPYTLDYKSDQDCPIEPCPKCSHPGVWVQPIIDLEDLWIGSNP